jgi:alkylation response protein AidB-like acyl-CoA dehydrogenase
MDFRFTPEDEAFRAELIEFLGREWAGGSGDSSVHNEEEFRAERELTKKLAARGWLTMAWPQEYGGQGAPHVRQAIMKEECAYAQVTGLGAPGGQGASMVGPAIIVHGSGEQKRRFLGPISRGELYWCQGFSEPNAGSDLAAVQTSAKAEGDHYVLNGHKIWTSGAEYGDWIHVLARTDPASPKHKGISYFLVDMKSQGITYAPIGQITGHTGFYETLFDNVIVPRENLLGDENRGWYVATTTLDFERSGVHRYGALKRWFDDLLAYIRDRPVADGDRVRLAEHLIEIEVGRWLAYRVAWLADNGRVPNYEASISKTFGTELSQRFANTAVNLLGLAGALSHDSCRAPLTGRPSFWYLMTVHYPISAGTNEIQRNIIAQRGLGLPREAVS